MILIFFFGVFPICTFSIAKIKMLSMIQHRFTFQHLPTTEFNSVSSCPRWREGRWLDPHLIRLEWVMCVSEGSANRNSRLALPLAGQPLNPRHSG